MKYGYQNHYTCVEANMNKPLPKHIHPPMGSSDIFAPPYMMWFPVESSLDLSGQHNTTPKTLTALYKRFFFSYKEQCRLQRTDMAEVKLQSPSSSITSASKDEE